MDYNKLLIESAENFKELTAKCYTVITGQKKKLHEVKIIITADGFKHLTGLHKARNHSEIYTKPSGALMRKILSGKFDINVLSSEDCFENIITRLTYLKKLESYLDNFTQLYKWSQKDAANAGIYSVIDADFMIPCNVKGQKVFLFLTKYENNSLKLCDIVTEHCIVPDFSELVSIQTLIVGELDYSRGQKNPPVMLYKEKYNKINKTSCVLLDKLHNQKAQPQAIIDALRNEAKDVPEMSLDEINAEIAAARAERKTRK